jgi:outer membrane lipoprotein LolB
LALRLDTEPPQSFSASFQLSGQANQGELVLLTPIGSTAAAMAWSPGGATLRNGAESRAFASLEAMVSEVTGTPLPVAALFDWLAGQATPAPGWEVDLARLPQGRLTAQRKSPQPQAELRLILD